MKVRATLALLTLLVPATAVAQHGASVPSIRSAPAEARQFDFLVGQWELVVTPKASGLAARIHGVPKLFGTWKAWRALDGWGVEDELRITDESGNPRALSHAVRIYDATAKRWNASTVDVYRGVFNPSTAEWRDARMTSTGRGTEADGKAYVSRVTYYDIKPLSFRFKQERSHDDGQTWDQTLGIEAKRVAATAPR